MLDITLKETRVYREIKEEGREEGREAVTLNLVICQLTKRFGELPQELSTAIAALPLPDLEALGESLLDFTRLSDLEHWLIGHQF